MNLQCFQFFNENENENEKISIVIDNSYNQHSTRRAKEVVYIDNYNLSINYWTISLCICKKLYQK